MKTKKFFYVFLAAVLFVFMSCNQNNDLGEVIDYPFETLYGSWTGIMGKAGKTVLKVYEDNEIILMDFKVGENPNVTSKCTIHKLSPAVYEAVWYIFDKATKTAAAEPNRTITVSVENENEIYITDPNMGGMTMKKN